MDSTSGTNQDVDRADPAYVGTIDIARIKVAIPHRYPFLMIDRVVELVRNRSAIGIKNVSVNENFFQGHFPGHPVMPGVLIIESMAQTAAVLVVETLGPAAVGRVVYFMSVERAKFRRPVVPGDQLRIHVTKERCRGNVWKFNAVARVDGLSVAEAELALRLSTEPVGRFDGLGIARFLSSDADQFRLLSFVDEWLGSLVAYDEEHRSELVHTLGESLRDQQSLRASSDRLHIHPSTLKYRLRRVQELTGRDLHDPDDRFNLDLACRVRASLVAQGVPVVRGAAAVRPHAGVGAPTAPRSGARPWWRTHVGEPGVAGVLLRQRWRSRADGGRRVLRGRMRRRPGRPVGRPGRIGGPPGGRR